MKCGEYRRVVVIQERDESSTDVLNHPVPDWTDYHRCRASGRPLGGREYFQAQQTQATHSHVYRVHYSDKSKAITPKMRLVDRTDGEQILNIVRVHNVDNKNREMELGCVEVQ